MQDDRSCCETCGVPYGIGDWPFCPHGPMRAFIVRPDSIPGGMVIENLGPTPQTFYSRSAFKDAVAAAGLEQKVQHVGQPGSDRSPFTQRWI